jgi:hypothetical protein
MKTVTLVGLTGLAMLAACGDNNTPPPVPPPPAVPGLAYTDPTGGALRLVKNAQATPTKMILDFIVGDQPVTGYSTGFNLPIDTTKVTMGPFTPGSALSAGTDPVAADAVIPTTGALAKMIVVGQSQKAAGTGAVATDTTLAAHTVLFTIELDAVQPFQTGVVFDGTAQGFVLPSGGLRTKAGNTAVLPADVQIGKLIIQ